MYRKKNRSKAILGKIAIISVLASGLLIIYFYNQYQYFISTPVNPQNTQAIAISIQKGDSTKQIAEQLFQKQLILNQDAFKIYTKINNLDKDLKTGRFSLNQSETVAEIAQILISNNQRQAIVTIPEGSTAEDIDKILTDLQLIQTGDFAKSVQKFDKYSKYAFLNENQLKSLIYPLEGYLFPDTYYVNTNDFSSEAFISLLLNTFAQKALPILKDSKHQTQDIINVAAMVEEETNQDQDRPIVAGIIWKRLEQKWPLGIDATLLYLKKERVIRYQDLHQDNNYNTRINLGLPAGPISNPGLDSIKAAAEPQTTTYFYYLTSRNGQMIYSTTNTEHNSNKAKYL